MRKRPKAHQPSQQHAARPSDHCPCTARTAAAAKRPALGSPNTGSSTAHPEQGVSPRAQTGHHHCTAHLAALRPKLMLSSLCCAEQAPPAPPTTPSTPALSDSPSPSPPPSRQAAPSPPPGSSSRSPPPPLRSTAGPSPGPSTGAATLGHPPLACLLSRAWSHLASWAGHQQAAPCPAWTGGRGLEARQACGTSAPVHGPPSQHALLHLQPGQVQHSRRLAQQGPPSPPPPSPPPPIPPPPSPEDQPTPPPPGTDSQPPPPFTPSTPYFEAPPPSPFAQPPLNAVYPPPPPALAPSRSHPQTPSLLGESRMPHRPLPSSPSLKLQTALPPPYSTPPNPLLPPPASTPPVPHLPPRSLIPPVPRLPPRAPQQAAPPDPKSTGSPPLGWYLRPAALSPARCPLLGLRSPLLHPVAWLSPPVRLRCLQKLRRCPKAALQLWGLPPEVIACLCLFQAFKSGWTPPVCITQGPCWLVPDQHAAGSWR